MCYVLTDNNFYIGKDFRGRPTAVTAKDKAFIFKTGVAANNFLRCIPDAIKRYNWIVSDLDERNDDYGIQRKTAGVKEAKMPHAGRACGKGWNHQL